MNPFSRGPSPRFAAALLGAFLAAGCAPKATNQPVAPAPASASPTEASPVPAAAALGKASLGDLAVTGAWARATAPGTTVGAVYLTVTNQGTAEDTLMALSSTAAAAAELHETSTDNDVARMRPLGPQLLSGGQSLVAEPGGLHIMLTDLKAPLVAGQTVPLTLAFKFAGALTVPVAVRSLDAVIPPAHAGH